MTPELENKILAKQITVLIDEIRTLVTPGYPAIEARIKWRKIFADEKEISKIVSEALKERKN